MIIIERSMMSPGGGIGGLKTSTLGLERVQNKINVFLIKHKPIN
jgi:hypothetical protein